MFIRWKRRKKAATRRGRQISRRDDPGDSLYCVLLESQRVNGVPRQKVICYLGSLDENDREKLWLRVDFWDMVDGKLTKIGLTRRDKAKIEEAIGRVVVRVPDAEATAFRLEREQRLQELEEIIQFRNMVSSMARLFK
ncbi:MAG TPA: hypothetical protein VFS76_13515 [Pyrinomonadaceae bacterium]|nr:hypothetical protein [Pyrinomonadaceae bacterium]